MAQVDNSYSFSITSDDVKVLAVHPKSGLPTVSVQGECTSPDGETYSFVATNNLDLRYADRFKVNWNGNKARMPVAAGHGLEEDVKEGRQITAQLIIPRGPRISIAKKCRDLFPKDVQEAMGRGSEEATEAALAVVDAS
jgi:hypothetical protein